MADDSKIDSISSLPDVILQNILSSITTKLAITTSLLSKRWRRVWCDTPCLSLDIVDSVKAVSVNETLSRYTAPKLMSFDLRTTTKKNIPHMDMWIKFAFSHNVENLSLDLTIWSRRIGDRYTFPEFFYLNSSLKQLSITLDDNYTFIPKCSVSWTSLKKLSLCFGRLSDESMPKILSGCPLLESLTLSCCDRLKVLDLSKSLHLRNLNIHCGLMFKGPKQIVAPHIRCLRMLLNYKSPCLLVDVSSLVEAKLGILFCSMSRTLDADFLQESVLNMLENFQNAEKLTFGENILQILSLAKIRGVDFPMLKVKALTLETNIDQYIIPGVERVLQKSPHLKKLTIHTRNNNNTIPGSLLDNYLELQGFEPDRCWRSKDGVIRIRTGIIKSKHVTSLLKLMLRNAKTLEKMVVQLNDNYLKFKDVVTTLSPNRNVSIVLSTEPKTTHEW
ncbi:unnamed protein product [Microthlaspi erraticum]|uniref:F-box domain-containing protein n=1 Tax=Microthlaspi erraticum TaxID=1685480 RepID=A0A6D2ISV3_9BRAS|nr:unnamed protein product [Microthlaspi erraticum]